MAKRNTALTAQLREEFKQMIIKFLEEQGHEVLEIASNTICIPSVDPQGEEFYFRLGISIPTGRGGDEFDGHLMALDYEQKKQEKIEKAKELAEKKRKKIEQDKKMRADKAEREKGK